MAEESLHHSATPTIDSVNDLVDDNGVAALRDIVAGTASETGAQFFHNLVEHLARAIDVGYAFIAEFIKPNRARTVAFWTPSGIAENVEWELPGTPCEEVVAGQLCHHPSGVHQKFPKDEPFVALGIESYLGVPLIASDGQHLGHLAVFDPRLMPEEPKKLFIFKIFAARAAAELNRLRAEVALRESEMRYRRLYEDAPVPYVYSDLDGMLSYANAAARDLFGLRPEEVAGFDAFSLIAPEPDAERRYRQSIAEIKSGQELIGHIQEFRRKSDSTPFWAQVWSRPDPDGKHTRTVLVDMTELVKAQRDRDRMEAMLRENEERLKDLFDEAPIAYVHEDIQSKFIRANRAAMRTLGIKPEEVQGTYGQSFIPDTAEARARFDQAFASIGRGTDTSGVVLELRRKDNGKPVWIQWWSKPDPSGAYTRTMFVDITDRVLMEQEKNRLSAQNIYLQEEIKSVHNFEEIVGRSPSLLEVLEKVTRVAMTDASVLITGETGTGKELVARAIHSASKRHDKPLIKVNCAALPESLVESELFGHEKGAFSGAINRRIGRFELAQGGTIFLDEIGEVPMDVQVKLLRVLQEREFERVGGSAPIKVDVRIIAATNRDLSKAIRDGHFREDLFYRLNVFPISLPPLRERDGDVRLLSQFLVNKFAARIGKRIDAITDSTIDRLNTYRWPGNIRELENVLERAIILSNSSTLEIDPDVFGPAPAAVDPSPRITAASGAPLPTNQDLPPTSLESVERDHILAVLKQTQWVIEGPRGAAKILDLHPNTLRSRLKKLGIERSSQ